MRMNDLYQLEKGGVLAPYEPYQVPLYPNEKLLFGNLDIPVKGLELNSVGFKRMDMLNALFRLTIIY